MTGADQSERAVWAVQVRDALARMDAMDRSALILTYGRGLTQSQAALELGVAEHVIRQRAARALRQLARIIVPPQS